MNFPLGGVVLQSIPGNWRKRVASTFVWADTDHDFYVTVPDGYITDGASIPRILWPFIGSPYGPYTDAAVIHDYLYSARKTYQKINRKEADLIFYKILCSIGISAWNARLMYWGVRIGGWRAWKKYEGLKYEPFI